MSRESLRVLRRAAATLPVILTLALPCSSASAAPHPHPSLARVLIVQRLFHELGYPLGRERSGTFGVRTRGALSYFQRKYGLPVTGYPDVGTVAQMQAVAASLRAAPGRTAPRERDLIQKLLGGAPVMGLALACALGLALLALAGRRSEPLADQALAGRRSEPLADR
jgi:Putative peptidoglycan binding domain